MNNPFTETLKKLYVDITNAINTAQQTNNWQTAGRLHNVACDLCWKIDEGEREAKEKDETAL